MQIDQGATEQESWEAIHQQTGRLQRLLDQQHNQTIDKQKVLSEAVALTMVARIIELAKKYVVTPDARNALAQDLTREMLATGR